MRKDKIKKIAEHFKKTLTGDCHKVNRLDIMSMINNSSLTSDDYLDLAQVCFNKGKSRLVIKGIRNET